MREKTDAVLGRKVHEHLVNLGLETPMLPVGYTEAEKIDIIRQSMADVLTTLGLDLNDDSLADTPQRVAKMYVKELFWGLQAESFPKCTTIENKMGYDEMVLEKDVKIMSACEHHLVTIDGIAHIAYIPGNKVLGLSKLNRIANYFARRPQVQERLTEQICAALQFILETDDVAVVIDATHYCVKSRGVEDTGSHTMTSKLGGAFKTNPVLRQEFMALVNK